MARLNLDICNCLHLRRDHIGGSAHCQANGDCQCLKYRKASGRSRYGIQAVAGCGSADEAERYRELQLLERGGYITGLERQKRMLVTPDGWPEIWWRVDFFYFEDGRPIAEEFKGVETEPYLLKRKLFRGRYAGEIELRVTAKERGRIVADPRDRKAA